MSTFISGQERNEDEYYESEEREFEMPNRIHSLQARRITQTPINVMNGQMNQRVNSSPVNQNGNYNRLIDLSPSFFSSFNYQNILQPQIPLQPQVQQQKENARMYTEHRNYQSYQQSVLIALINKYGDVVIRKEKKRSNKTVPFYTIQTIIFGSNDKINFDDYIQRRCTEKKTSDILNGINEKTATRRYKTNKITEVLHTLIDLLMIRDEELEISSTRYKAGITRTETMIGFYVERERYGENEIKTIGNQINQYLQQLLVNGEVRIPQSALFNYFFSD